MKGLFAKALATLVAVLLSFSAASAATIDVGVLSFDENTPTGNSFNIVNLTGLGFPLETVLDFDVTSLVAALEGGGTLTIGNSSFTDYRRPETWTAPWQACRRRVAATSCSATSRA